MRSPASVDLRGVTWGIDYGYDDKVIFGGMPR